ncbi:MAG: outer membrane protein assembly factor BamD [Bradymonadia bacterium]|jgi:outer membrane protein assembly factor BamD
MAIRVNIVTLRLALALALPSSAAVIAGCGAPQVGEQTYAEAAELAFAESERAFDRKDYELARARFQRVYAEYPYSELAAIAQLRIADCFRAERVHLRAIEQYRRFIRSHPSHQRVPEAEFNIALSYADQMPNDVFLLPPAHERDLSETENAYRALRVFLSEHGDSPFAGEAEQLLVRTRERLAAYELYTAEFYVRRDNMRGAAQRATFLIDNYPDSVQVPPALFLLGRAMTELGDVVQATSHLQRLVSEYPEHALTVEALDWLAQYAP